MAKQAKAIAGVLAVVGTNLLVFVTGSETLRDVTTAEWITVAIETLAVYGAVYGVPNSEPAEL